MLLLTLLLATTFPSTSKTSWMRPDSFHLTIGMSRSDAVVALSDGGWKVQKGDDDDHVIVDYDTDKAMTLEFTGTRLSAIRFELFAFIPDIKKAFQEERAYLRKTLGPPKKSVRSPDILLYDNRLPNVMAVLSASVNSENGRKGLGFLAVRYYDPLIQTKVPAASATPPVQPE